MSREILFKAKRMDNGEWVEGYLYRLHESLIPFIRGVMTNIWGWDECAGGYGVIETEPLNNYMAKGIKVIGNIYDGEGHEA